MLASMSEIDPHADPPLVDWSELSVSGLLPTGTVTLLLADIEGSTRLWETQPDQMTAAMARMNATVSATIATHRGGRPGRTGRGRQLRRALPPRLGRGRLRAGITARPAGTDPIAHRHPQRRNP